MPRAESAGSIAVARNIFSHPLFEREPYSEREAWIWLCAEAQWKDDPSRCLKRGQLAHSQRFMCEAWNWTRARVRRFIEKLQKNKMIVYVEPAHQSAHESAILTICNYDKYQPSRPTNRPSDRPKLNNNLTDRTEYEDSPHQEATVSPADEVKDAVSAYNQAAERQKWPLAQKINQTRQRHVRARLSDCGGLPGWLEAMRKAEASDFLTGKTGRSDQHASWTPDLDWFAKESNFVKLMEGKYDNKTRTYAADGLTRANGHKPQTGANGALAGMAALRRQFLEQDHRESQGDVQRSFALSPDAGSDRRCEANGIDDGIVLEGNYRQV